MICASCHTDKPVDQFYHNARLPSGRANFCIPCFRASQNRYQGSRRYRTAVRRRQEAIEQDPVRLAEERAYHCKVQARYRIKHRDRYLARAVLQKAMLYNRITKPALCEHCKAPPKKGQIGGYHWHGYSNPLDVKWLCPRCQGMARKGFITFEEKI